MERQEKLDLYLEQLRVMIEDLEDWPEDEAWYALDHAMELQEALNHLVPDEEI